jgi:uncharacterized paraquat-inducible protein A
LTTNDDLLLGKLAVRERMCSQEQIDECLNIQSMTRSDAPLSDLLLYKGYLNEAQIKGLVGRRRKKLMSCPSCRLSFTVVTLGDGASARCPRCKGSLEDSSPDRQAGTDAELSTRRVPLVPPSGGVPVKAVCIICDHSFEAARDPSGRVRCPSCQSTFTPR